MALSFIESIEEAWPPELENALIHAIEIFKTTGKKKIRDARGKPHGRNQLIASYLLKNYGKVRTPRQIASHMQVLMKRGILKTTSDKTPRIKRVSFNLTPQYLIQAESFNGMELTGDGVVAFRNLPEDQKHDGFFKTSPKDFSNIDNLIEKFYEMLPLRRISAEKLAFLYSLINYPIMEYENIMVRGITFVVPNIMPEISFENIRNRFDDTLDYLYSKMPLDSFFLGKVWVNLEHIQKIKDILSYNFDYVFYSPYIMDICMTQTTYILGKPIVVMKSTLSRTEASDGSSKYFIYQAKLPYESCESSYVDKLIKLKENYGYDLVKKVAQNQGRLIVLTDQHTNEILFVSIILAEYVPNFTGYQFCRVIE